MSTFWDNAQTEDGVIEGPAAEGALTLRGMEWDTLLISGMAMPGLATVTVSEISRRLQNKKENGSDGSSPTFRGLNPAKVEIELLLWTPDQLRTWEAMLPVIFPRAGKGTNGLSGLDISHPNTALCGIRAIVIESVTGLMPGPSHGTKAVKLKCFEFMPPKKAKAVKTVVSAVAVRKAFQQPTPLAGASAAVGAAVSAASAAVKNAPAAPSTTDTIPDFLRRPPAQGSS